MRRDSGVLPRRMCAGLPPIGSMRDRLTVVNMPAESAQSWEGWHANEAPSPPAACVHQLFEQQVERTPDATALMFGEETLSYRELNSRANALANLLRSQGLGADSVVGICVERSFDMVASVLAVLKAGAAYLPLDPAYPHERLQFMLEDSHAAILLTQTKLRHVFPNRKMPAIFLDEDWPHGAHPNGENLENITAPQNLSYLVYTSGSTGKPKGVAMVHRALVNMIDWQLKDSRLSAAARTLQFTSLSFDVSFQEIFSTLCLGGTLVLIPAELRLNPRELWNFIAREKIARIFLPFVALQQLADAAVAEGTRADALREVVTAGEQLQVTPKLREMFARHPEATLHNHYGPSETHVVTALTLSGDPRQWPALPSIGRPIQNTHVYLLEENGEPAPAGVPGELCVGGVALARGYFERPDVTAEKFVRDPFRDEPGARLYKTGDLARWLPNGEIEFLGRIDQQVKIRGYPSRAGRNRGCPEPAARRARIGRRRARTIARPERTRGLSHRAPDRHRGHGAVAAGVEATFARPDGALIVRLSGKVPADLQRQGRSQIPAHSGTAHRARCSRAPQRKALAPDPVSARANLGGSSRSEARRHSRQFFRARRALAPGRQDDGTGQGNHGPAASRHGAVQECDHHPSGRADPGRRTERAFAHDRTPGARRPVPLLFFARRRHWRRLLRARPFPAAGRRPAVLRLAARGDSGWGAADAWK